MYYKGSDLSKLALVTGGLVQRWQYENVGHLKYLLIMLLRHLLNIMLLKYTTFCPIFYIAC